MKQITGRTGLTGLLGSPVALLLSISDWITSTLHLMWEQKNFLLP